MNNLDTIENEARFCCEASNWAWLTSREMGFALEKELSDLEHARDRQEGRQTVTSATDLNICEESQADSWTAYFRANTRSPRNGRRLDKERTS